MALSAFGCSVSRGRGRVERERERESSRHSRAALFSLPLSLSRADSTRKKRDGDGAGGGGGRGARKLQQGERFISQKEPDFAALGKKLERLERARVQEMQDTSAKSVLKAWPLGTGRCLYLCPLVLLLVVLETDLADACCQSVQCYRIASHRVAPPAPILQQARPARTGQARPSGASSTRERAERSSGRRGQRRKRRLRRRRQERARARAAEEMPRFPPLSATSSRTARRCSVRRATGSARLPRWVESTRSPPITSHHITSHRITSHHITLYHITSHQITSHHITSHHITSHHIHTHTIPSHPQPPPSPPPPPRLCVSSQEWSNSSGIRTTGGG